MGDTEKSKLEALKNAGDRAGYYKQLEDWGYRYGSLARAVVTGELLSGRMANAFLAETAYANHGLRIDGAMANDIGMALMDADFRARFLDSQSSHHVQNGEDLGFKPVWDYHTKVFTDFGLDGQSWTASAPLEMAGKYPHLLKDPNGGYFQDSVQAQEFMWDLMLDAGDDGIPFWPSQPSNQIEQWMARVANATGDETARQWVLDLQAISRDEAAYVLGGDGSPYPPDGEPLSRDTSQYCFTAGTPIVTPEGTTVPIESLAVGDWVMAFDPAADGGRGGMAPRQVTQSHSHVAPEVLDFHGTHVTPGHRFLTGEGGFEEIVQILERDGTVVQADGTVVRARTNYPVGSTEDRIVVVGYADDTGETRHVSMRAGVPFGMKDGKVVTLLGFMAMQGYALNSDGQFVNIDGETALPLWDWDEPPPAAQFEAERPVSFA